MLLQALGDVRQRALEETRAAAASRAQAESNASAARADARAARDELARLQVPWGMETVTVSGGAGPDVRHFSFRPADIYHCYDYRRSWVVMQVAICCTVLVISATTLHACVVPGRRQSRP